MPRLKSLHTRPLLARKTRGSNGNGSILPTKNEYNNTPAMHSGPARVFF
jgi:hypothetical protein